MKYLLVSLLNIFFFINILAITDTSEDNSITAFSYKYDFKMVCGNKDVEKFVNDTLYAQVMKGVKKNNNNSLIIYYGTNDISDKKELHVVPSAGCAYISNER